MKAIDACGSPMFYSTFVLKDSFLESPWSERQVGPFRPSIHWVRRVASTLAAERPTRAPTPAPSPATSGTSKRFIQAADNETMASAGFDAVQHLRKPMDFSSWPSANHSDAEWHCGDLQSRQGGKDAV